MTDTIVSKIQVNSVYRIVEESLTYIPNFDIPRDFENHQKSLKEIFENPLKIPWKSLENPLKTIENYLNFKTKMVKVANKDHKYWFLARKFKYFQYQNQQI